MFFILYYILTDVIGQKPHYPQMIRKKQQHISGNIGLQTYVLSREATEAGKGRIMCHSRTMCKTNIRISVCIYEH